MAAGDLFNSSTSLVPVNVLVKVYLKAVLAPLLFLFYINDLASLVNKNAVIALLADDISILTKACKKEDAEAATQSLVNSIVILSQELKLNLNADKSEVCPFSLLGQMTAPGILLSLLVLRKFVSTLISSV